METQTKKHGGKRPGAGRPKKETPGINLTIRVPASTLKAVREKHGKSLTVLITEFLSTLITEK